jgi:PAS domain-containing protein
LLEAKSITFADAMMAVNGSGKDIPVIASTGKLEEDRVIEAIVAGARDVVVRGRPEHLRKVVRNEFDVLEDRRSLRRIEAALNESERRCDSLIASSRDPIAYVVDGMHIRANEAYLEMFGYEEFDEIEGLPLLDMVATSTRRWSSRKPSTKAKPACRSSSASVRSTRTWSASWTSCVRATRPRGCSTANTSSNNCRTRSRPRRAAATTSCCC